MPVSLCLDTVDTVSYFWFPSEKNTVTKKHHPDRIPLMDENIEYIL